MVMQDVEPTYQLIKKIKKLKIEKEKKEKTRPALLAPN
jgi:hypothetical protein